MLLLAHWGDIDAFKPPVHAGGFSLAVMKAEEFVPPTDDLRVRLGMKLKI